MVTPWWAELRGPDRSRMSARQGLGSSDDRSMGGSGSRDESQDRRSSTLRAMGRRQPRRPRRRIRLHLMLRSTFLGECPNCVFGSIFERPWRARARCNNCGMRFDPDGSNWLSVGFLCCMFALLVVIGEGIALGVAFGLFRGLEWVLLGSGVATVAVSYRPLLGWWVWCLWTYGFLDSP